MPTSNLNILPAAAPAAAAAVEEFDDPAAISPVPALPVFPPAPAPGVDIPTPTLNPTLLLLLPLLLLPKKVPAAGSGLLL
jgi:hypothetical protein